MQRNKSFSNINDLPSSIRRDLGLGISKAKIFDRDDGQLIAKAIQDIGQVTIRLTHISRADKAKTVELTDSELHRVLLMAKDLIKQTGQETTIEPVEPDMDNE